jgi:GDP-D-mannose dehydratase
MEINLNSDLGEKSKYYNGVNDSLLLDKNYIVYGIVRRASDINTQRIDHLFNNKNLILEYGDMTDSPNLLHILYNFQKISS